MTATEQALTKLHDLLAPIPALGSVLQDMDEDELAALPVNIQAALAHIAIAETKLWMMFTAELRHGPRDEWEDKREETSELHCTCPASVRESWERRPEVRPDLVDWTFPGAHHSLACPMYRNGPNDPS